MKYFKGQKLTKNGKNGYYVGDICCCVFIIKHKIYGTIELLWDWELTLHGYKPVQKGIQFK